MKKTDKLPLKCHFYVEKNYDDKLSFCVIVIINAQGINEITRRLEWISGGDEF